MKYLLLSLVTLTSLFSTLSASSEITEEALLAELYQNRVTEMHETIWSKIRSQEHDPSIWYSWNLNNGKILDKPTLFDAISQYKFDVNGPRNSTKNGGHPLETPLTACLDTTLSIPYTDDKGWYKFQAAFLPDFIKNRKTTLKLLLEFHADPNRKGYSVTDNEETLPLSLALKRGHDWAIDLLVANGASV